LVVRRHAAETGQRYTEAKADIEDLDVRIHHSPVAERLVAHLRDRYGIDAVRATQLSQHVGYVMRIDRHDGEPWVARAFPPARPVSGAEGDAAVLRFLERHGYPAEGRPRQDLLAALAFLDSVDTKVAAADRGEFEELRDPRGPRAGRLGVQRP
jgi:hypothetical protein